MKTSLPAVRMRSKNVFKISNIFWLQVPLLKQFSLKTGMSEKAPSRFLTIRLGVILPPNTCDFYTVYTSLGEAAKIFKKCKPNDTASDIDFRTFL